MTLKKLLTISMAFAWGLATPAIAAPTSSPRASSRQIQQDIKKGKKGKEDAEKDRKKRLREAKRRATILQKELKKITPLPPPHVQVDESELPELEKAAEAGDTAAMVRLGHYCMMHDKPGFTNEKEAAEHFRKAADAGDADARAWLALYNYVNATGTDKDAQEKCYQEVLPAAQDGSIVGTYLAALMSKDAEEKAKLHEKAARAGFVPSMRALGESIAEATYYNQASRYDPVPADACLWLELAIDCGDAAAAIVRSGCFHMHRSSDSTPDTDTVDTEKWLRRALQLALKGERHWYGNIFDRFTPVRQKDDWGGDRVSRIMSIYGRLVSVRAFDDRNPNEIAHECCNTLKKMADAGEPDAMAAAIMLTRKWSFWMGLDVKDPGILKESVYMPKLRKMADEGNLLARRMIKACNMVGK